ncbi:hypothetical protein EBB07_21575 [Paenibacillaceae bacterium]|nr:hypothetical protein EBB07_21575 [Paenibacillaceae bacterium]
MKIKSIMIAIVITASLVVSGSAYAFSQINSVTTEENGQSNSSEVFVTEETKTLLEINEAGEELLAVSLEEQPDNLPTRIDASTIKDEINIPLDLASNPIKRSLATDNPIKELTEVRGERNGDINEVVAFYTLEDGKHEIIIFQTINPFANKDTAVDEFKKMYPADVVKTQNINGKTAVIEDADHRKQVHLISETHTYSISSPGTLNLEYLIEIAEQIEE